MNSQELSDYEVLNPKVALQKLSSCTREATEAKDMAAAWEKLQK